MIDLNAIHEGLNHGEFFIEYLPTVCLDDQHCLGAEALIRWRRPEGIVPPVEFIPLVENTPLSGLITYWVIDTVAAELSDWLRAHPAAHLSLNVPPEILGRGGLEYAAVKSGLRSLSAQIILEDPARLACPPPNQASGCNLCRHQSRRFSMIKSHGKRLENCR